MRSFALACLLLVAVAVVVADEKSDNYQKRVGKKFLDEKEALEGVTKTPSGLLYKVLSRGSGTDKPKATDTVEVHYRGTLKDGTEFDSSIKRGQPASFPLNGVISGWTEGLQLMSPGDKFEFYIPYELAYGARGSPPRIPGFSPLVFEVELLSIKGKKSEL